MKTERVFRESDAAFIWGVLFGLYMAEFIKYVYMAWYHCELVCPK